MNLDQAIELLCRIHTKDDEEAGFKVEIPVTSEWFRPDDYIQAWEAMRKQRDFTRTNPEASK